MLLANGSICMSSSRPILEVRALHQKVDTRDDFVFGSNVNGFALLCSSEWREGGPSSTPFAFPSM